LLISRIQSSGMTQCHLVSVSQHFEGSNRTGTQIPSDYILYGSAIWQVLKLTLQCTGLSDACPSIIQTPM